jgi:biofilm PGA synthesis N-glycosyltransferase PgaC
MSLEKKYIVITPVRDEEKHIENVIRSMISQQIIPAQWIIVDDGSTDRTGSIAEEYSSKYSWISVIHRQDRGLRKPGSGVVEAFYDGLNSLTISDWDFLVKLDGDLSFDSDYFKKCFDYFADDPKLGIGGGDIYHDIGGKLVLEKTPVFHVRGATKIYRKACWDALGGLIVAPGWDTLDEVKANMLGWETHSFVDLKLIHHKYTGSADGRWGGWVKNGRANYISGYHPVFMMLKCIRRMFKKPVLVSALGLLYGFVSGYFKGIPQVNDRALINYLRRQQMNRILMKESIWK